MPATKPRYAPPTSAWNSPPMMLDRGTWLEADRDGHRRARAIFPDGKARVIRVKGTADTWFSVAAIGTFPTPEGRRHAYVTSAESPDGTERYFELRICKF